MSRNDPPSPSGTVESLYPFLYAREGPGGEREDLSAVMEQVRASTRAKAAEIGELRQTIARRDAERIAACAGEMARRFAAGGRLFAFGNGGSATDAQQLTALFMGESALPAFALANETAVVTALANDIGTDVVFARQIAAFGGANDIAVGLSTSGNSANLPPAFGEARRLGMLTVGLAGYEGGTMAELANHERPSIDYLFVAPSASVHRIQEAQTTIYQVLWELTVQEVTDVPRHTG